MKKIISRKNIEICIAVVFVLSSMGLINFASADVATSTENRKPNKGFDQRREEEMIRKISDKRVEIERKMLEIKEMEGRLDGKMEEKKLRFGTSTFATSTRIFGASTASTTIRNRLLERVKREGEKIVERFDESIKRLENSYEKISEKISKFEKKGVSVTETKALLAIAKSKIDIAKSDVDVLAKAINDGIGSQNRKDYYALIKNLSNKAKDSIKNAQRALSDTINSLKPGFNKNDKHSSSTATTSSVSSITTSSSGISSSVASSATSSSSSL